MAWAGGEYGDDEEDELNRAPIEEILAVTREDQDMLTEAHKALRREIKSIRKALKKLVRQFYDYSDTQESTAPEWSDVSSVVESDIHLTKDIQETVSDFVLDSDCDHQSEYTNVNVRSHSETESLQDVDEIPRDEIEFEKQSNNDNGYVRSKKSHRIKRRPDSTPPMIGYSHSDATSRDSSTVKHRRHQLGRSATQIYVPLVITDDWTTPSERPLSRNSDSADSFSTVEDNVELTDLDAEQFNNTYPGSSSHHHATSQNAATKSLKNFGRRNAQNQFSRTDLENQHVQNKSSRNGDAINGDGKIAEHSKSVKRTSLQRRFTQEEIRQAGSQLRFPRHMRRNNTNPQIPEKRPHPAKHFDEPPPSSPPPPPPSKPDSVELPPMEDQLGAIPEFSNSFQALPRRLSSSEISAIGGETHSNQLPRMKKFIRNASHPITVTEVIAT